ncbi:DUF4247 domain-containing protein [Paenibacillus piri]|uniref:DUF4247 domain-containing protein n=1 Tax=Paenibacillus piri TaxID=2547395 RepID=A0A4R5KJZ6_9BACL|nr:DUF4247 domain-containing protein [Paenibacillus piri]TDF95851.1 DUF4247 domain-containing protein [Paenibacillus piri]
MKKRWLQMLAVLLVISLVAGCGDASNYVKENYQLIDVQGQGKSTAKIYSVEGKDVPTVAKELAANEKPKETSKESKDQMFLVYDNKIVNVHKDPEQENNTLVELDSIEYAKENYDSSFLQGYIAASLLQSLFGGGWSGSQRGSDYRGYTPPKQSDSGKSQTAPSNDGKSPAATPPTTTDRKGSFNTAPTTKAPSSGSSARKSDGSSPTYKAPSSSKSGSKPSTSTRSGSFKRK